MNKHVLIPFTSGVEEIELVAVVDILRRANIGVTMASLDGQPVVGRSGITLKADTKLSAITNQAWDMLVLPGGLPNADLLKENPDVQKIAQTLATQNKYVAAICAAPAALAHFGLLDDKQATSHPCAKQTLEQHVRSYQQQAVVEDDAIVTSRGAGTAIAFALHLVMLLTDQQTADDIKTTILA